MEKFFSSLKNQFREQIPDSPLSHKNMENFSLSKSIIYSRWVASWNFIRCPSNVFSIYVFTLI